MNAIKPLTSTEAVSLCHQFSTLIGKTMVCEPMDFFMIEHIVTSPFNEQDKDTFATRFVKSGNALESISFYKGDDFDVMLFARNVADKDMQLYESLQNYLQHDNIDLTMDEIPSYII